MRAEKSDIFFLEKKTLFGKKYIPVFITTAGVSKTITLDEIRSFGRNARGELVALDDKEVADIVALSIAIGEKMGEQKAMKEARKYSFWTFIITVIVFMIVLYVLIYVVDISSKLL